MISLHLHKHVLGWFDAEIGEGRSFIFSEWLNNSGKLHSSVHSFPLLCQVVIVEGSNTVFTGLAHVRVSISVFSIKRSWHLWRVLKKIIISVRRLFFYGSGLLELIVKFFLLIFKFAVVVYINDIKLTELLLGSVAAGILVLFGLKRRVSSPVS